MTVSNTSEPLNIQLYPLYKRSWVNIFLWTELYVYMQEYHTDLVKACNEERDKAKVQIGRKCLLRFEYIFLLCLQKNVINNL